MADRIEELEREIERLNLRLEAYEAKSGYMTAQQMLDNAVAWIERNPEGWRFLQERATYCIVKQKRFSVKRALEELRDSHLLAHSMADDDYKISNSYSAVFARLLLKEKPQLEGLITLKRSKVDGVLS